VRIRFWGSTTEVDGVACKRLYLTRKASRNGSELYTRRDAQIGYNSGGSASVYAVQDALKVPDGNCIEFYTFFGI